MSSSGSQIARDFLVVAVRLGLLSAEQAEEVSRDSAAKGTTPDRLVQQKGLLSSVQVDIVETLLQPLDTAPGYEILSVLGQGGMGVVYRARQLNLQRIVALKTVLLSQLADPKTLARFEQEARAVASLQHPHIVGAYDYGRHEGRVYFAMEFVEGENASDFVAARGPLSEWLAWQLARQAAAGLAHAAALGVVHRDVKPSNMLLVQRAEGYLLPAGVPLVKLADFGLAQLSHEAEANTRLTSTGMAVGSPHYMSPEQLSGERVDLRSDIYSLGASVYHLLAGAPPFEGQTLPKLISAKLLSGGPPLGEVRPNVTAATEELLAAMMARDPDQRPASYGELLARIDALGDLPGPDDVTGPIRIVSFARGHETQRGMEPTAAISAAGHETPTGTAAQAARMAPPQIPSPDEASSSARTLWMAIGAVALLGVAVAIGLVAFRPPAGPRGPRDLQPSGAMASLFSGQGLDDWPAPQSGLWDVGRDGEGARVLVGSRGAQQRPLPKAEHYRLNLAVELVDARAAEIHFGIPDSDSAAKTCGVLRLTADQAELSLCDRTNQRTIVALRPRSEDAPKGYRAVHIERQSADWWVFVDNALVGTLPLDATGNRPLVQFQADGGAARFADLAVQPLAVKAAE